MVDLKIFLKFHLVCIAQLVFQQQSVLRVLYSVQNEKSILWVSLHSGENLRPEDAAATQECQGWESRSCWSPRKPHPTPPALLRLWEPGGDALRAPTVTLPSNSGLFLKQFPVQAPPLLWSMLRNL